jgi:hypothetical protein
MNYLVQNFVSERQKKYLISMQPGSCLSKPYVPMTIEELSKVTSLKHWANVKVRVVGTVMLPSTLVSIFERGGPYNIALDLHLLDVYPQHNTNIQVYGELQMCSAVPQIRVFFFRKLDGLDIENYHRAIDYQKKYVPHFIKL